jgi:hypothetical protein
MHIRQSNGYCQVVSPGNAVLASIMAITGLTERPVPWRSVELLVSIIPRLIR